jgi:predicted ABC-type ATPase
MAGPVVVMVAGPNGAGKSSIAPRLLAQTLGVLEYVNADVIARGISGFNWDGAALSAGRIMLERLDELTGQKVSFAFETTGASRSFEPRIGKLRERGYRFLLIYIWVQTAGTAVERVAKRVLLGGHGVPEDTVRRRFCRGLVNFFDLYRPIADEWRFYDNSGAGDAKLVAEGGLKRPEAIHGVETWQNTQRVLAEARQKS